MRIGVNIDNVLTNFNEVLLNNYINHDKELKNKGIINKDVAIRKMFDYFKNLWKNSINFFYIKKYQLN